MIKMHIFLKKLKDKIKSYGYIKAFVDSVAFTASVIAIIGLPLILSQLKELNSLGEVNIKFHLATSTIDFGPFVSEPVDLRLIIRNEGSYAPPYWRAGLIFCKDINIVTPDSNWLSSDQKQYFLKSDENVFYNNTLFSDDLDKIGIFKIILPSKNELIPIAIAVISGERNSTPPKLVSLSLKDKDFTYENLQTQDGNLLTDLQGCMDVRGAPKW